MAPSKPTKADLDAMQTQLNQIHALKSAMANDSALTALDGTIDVKDGIGDLIDGQGMQLSSYYLTIAQAVRTETQKTMHALDSVATLLDTTIKGYREHETNAKNTPTAPAPAVRAEQVEREERADMSGDPYGAYYDSSGTTIDRSSGDFTEGSIPGLTCLGVQGGQEGESGWSAAWSGGGDMLDKVHSAMQKVNLDIIDGRRQQWEKVMTSMDNHARTLHGIRNALAGVWHGDDADSAIAVFDGHTGTMYQRASDAALITGGLRNTHDQLKWCKDKWGHDQGFGSDAWNWASGDDDRASANDYNTTVKNVVTAMNEMPQSTPSQLKGGAGNPYTQTPDMPTGGGPSGAPNMGAGGPGAHGNVPMPGVGDPGNLPNPGLVDPPVDPPPVDPLPPIDPNPPVDPPWVSDPPSVDNPNLGNIDAPNTSGLYGTDVPNLDSGTSLAGYDGGGGIAGGGAPGLGGFGAGGGAPGLGSGGAGLGAGGGTAGLGGAGAGAGGAGVLVGGGAGTAGGAGGARGGMGAMPMRGGGAGGGDDDERQRSTWLEEDEDVWGGSDAPPGVISD